MARERPLLFAMNGGRVSPLAMARVDLQRMKLTAEEYHNCFPRVIGPMTFRPGFRFGAQVTGNAVARNLPFIFAADDTALIKLTDESLNIVISDSLISRASVATTVTNGDFSSGTGWTLANADINSTVSGALVMQAAVRGTTASAKRTFSVAGGDQAVEHAIRIVVLHGAPRFKLGTSDGAGDIIAETELLPGTHSIAFTPNAATVYLEFNTQKETRDVVDSAQIEAAGTFSLPTPWDVNDLFRLRYEQSGDVIFVTHSNYQPYRIERRGTRSWSITKYQFRNGPYRGKTANITLTPSVRLGNGTLTASAPFFTADHVGCLFQLTHTQSVCNVSLAGNDVYSDTIRISGRQEGQTRNLTYGRTGTYVGTLSLQVADDKDGPWQNRFSPVAVASDTINPGSDNAITWCRIGFQAGDYTSGQADVVLTAPGGGGVGVVRVTGFTSSTVVNIEVVERLHYDKATADWQEGKYSDVNGWPASVALFEGRLWFGGEDQIAGSVSDSYTNFDLEEEGDSGPIIRSIATGPVNRVQWILGLARLILGTSGAESVARSSSFDEPMTPTNFSIKDASTYGSADIQGVKVDRSGVFVHRSGKRAYRLQYSIEAQDYISQEVSRYDPSILLAGVKIIAVQRQPDTRIWFVLNDGTAAVLVDEGSEDVLAWCTVETDGDIEDVCVTPNLTSDDVHFIVKRNINGSDVRYRERLAYDTEAQGGSSNRMADCFKVVTLAASATVTGLSHLEGETVVVWQGSAPLLTAAGEPATFTVASSQITLPAPYTGDVVVGLAYEGRWKSTKLAYAAQTGTAISQRKIIHAVAPLLYSTHNRAALFGQNFTRMDPLPRVIKGSDQGLNTLLADHDYDLFALPGEWSNDSRLCMKFRAPLPATVLGIAMSIESHERA